MAFAFAGGTPKQGMMEIGIALVLQDRFSNQAAQASSQIRNLQQEARMAVQANLATAANLGQMGLGAFRTMASGIAEMVNYGAEFVDTMTTVDAITQASVESMNQLKDTAMSLGKTTMFSSQEVASGMKYLAMAGNTAEDIQNMIKGATYAAGATGMALGGKGGAADVITNVMKTFQLSGEKAALEVGDIMTNATLSANISMQDLAASIRYAAADMTVLGYKLPEVSAAIGTLGNMGIQGSMAGTALANMVRYLNKSISDPSYKGHTFLEQVGLTKEDLTTADGHLKDLFSIMSAIDQATKNMDATERTLFTTGVFGVRGNRAAQALLRDMEGFARLYQDVANTTPGFAQEVVAQRMGTVAGQLNAMKSTWENLKAAFTEALSGYLIPIFKTITKWLDGMRKILGTGIGKVVAGITLLGTALLGIASTLLIIRTRIQMLQINSQVTGRNMFAVLTGGWRAAYLAAADYAKMEQLIINQRRAGIMGKAGTIAMASGYTVGGVKMINTQRGVRYMDTTTGRFIRATDPRVTAALGAGAATTATAVVGKGLSAATRVGGRLLSFGGKLFNLFGGWVGLAITGISIVLPLIVNALSKNKNATLDNNEALNSNTAAVTGLSSAYQEEKNKQADRALTERQEMMIVINLLGQIVRGQKDQTINLNLTTPSGGTQSLSFNANEDYDEDIMSDMSLY